MAIPQLHQLKCSLRFLPAVVSIIGVLLLSASAYEAPSELRFGIFDEEGALETSQLSEFEGKIVVLYYFSPW